MDMRHLNYFIAVAEEENIGRAARRLNISQPPLTRQIHQLEDELGVMLFVRTPRGVEMTEAGVLLLEQARNIRTLVDQTIEQTQRAGQGRLGRLDIGIFGSAILDVVPKLLMAFHSQYPGVRVVLHTMSKAEQIEALRQRRISVGFNRLLTPLEDIEVRPVLTESLLVALQADHPMAAREKVSFSELAGHPMVLFPTGGRPSFIDKVISLFGEVRVPLTISQEVGDVVTALALVSAGMGFCLVPESATVLQFRNVVYRPLADAPANGIVDLSCIYRKDDRSAVLASFLETVETYRSGAAPAEDRRKGRKTRPRSR